MRWALLLVLSTQAWADIPPENPATLPDLSCAGQFPGAACGKGGECTAKKVRRPDFSNGVPPTWKWTEVLICKGPQPVKPPLVVLFALMFLIATVSLSLRGRGLTPWATTERTRWFAPRTQRTRAGPSSPPRAAPSR